jgi:hypothetical protein
MISRHRHFRSVVRDAVDGIHLKRRACALLIVGTVHPGRSVTLTAVGDMHKILRRTMCMLAVGPPSSAP